MSVGEIFPGREGLQCLLGAIILFLPARIELVSSRRHLDFVQ